MDIKKIAEELVDKIKSNPKLLSRFKEEPVKVIEELTGLDLPDNQLKQVAELVKAKIDLDKMGDALGMLGGLFGKK